ncbi:MAG: carbohydrate ABC transporter permease [Paracholeplasma sp.]|uniref:ABC transporter, permease protein n=1 Tax=Acholeplasma brassicae TaxID=61635 RepID=U4KMH3_9MOLU|nr:MULTISPECIES: carbohydrate ABC transporter permease [Paracholeplasma]MDY3196402.1 carbohydrate ABC transporter permease [Paracholeplasma sp.]CCV65305.1 ABC transporter, permease protein [Paracholeplasma brassicae]
MTTNKRIQLHKRKKRIKEIVKYTILVGVGFVMLYPLLWIVGASFNDGPMASFWFIPENFTLVGWQGVLKAPGWGSIEGYSMLRALWNTLQYTLPQTFFMTFTTLLTAFVMTRMTFKGKKIVFAIIIATILMPNTIFRIPMFAFWTTDFMLPFWDNELPFLSYLPLWAGALFAVNSFSVFMYIQFFRSIPKDLDEAAYMDGANTFQVLIYVLIPILKPIIMTVGLLLFISAFNDYQGPLIYRGATSTYPLSIVLSTLTVDSMTTYAHVYAKSIFGVLLLIIVFFSAQRYFVGNDSDSAIKG